MPADELGGAEHPLVSIVILNWNGLDDTVECLESLNKITYPRYEVVVVDNGSEGDDARVLEERYKHFRVIRNERNLGFAEGNNVGISDVLAKSAPDWVLLLNNDTVVHPRFLHRLIEVAQGDERIGILGPKVRFSDEPNRLQAAGGSVNMWTGITRIRGFGRTDTGEYDEIGDVDWVLGCALLIRSSLIPRIGPLHKGYFAYLEETEWCLRCKRLGYRVIYVPEALIWHKGARSAERVRGRSVYFVNRNRFLFMLRNARKSQVLFFLLFDLFLHLPLATTRTLLLRTPRLLPALYRGKYDGVKLLFSR